MISPPTILARVLGRPGSFVLDRYHGGSVSGKGLQNTPEAGSLGSGAVKMDETDDESSGSGGVDVDGMGGVEC